MCGIAGFFDPGGFEAGQAERLVTEMTQRIRMRGPDAQSYWCDGQVGVALGHARLAIIDVSESGAQPMVSASGRYVMVFNGEIYNHLDLRDRLAQGFGATDYRGSSDTESLLAGIEAWGLKETLQLCVGMFAFALWDRQDRELNLGRDRFGEKPLYYGWQRSGGPATLLFGSQLKALHAHPRFEGQLDRNSAVRFFERLCVPGEDSIFEGISKVKPGTFLTFDAGTHEPKQTEYWSLAEASRRGADNRFSGNNAELLERTDEIVSRAVKRQMLSDVPLGAFLSGGVDSSTVVALMARYSATPVKTFTIGFADDRFDESAHAAAVAQHLGTDHSEITVTTTEAQAVVPQLCEIYDEPFADSSQIPTFIVSQLARRDVTVSLTGDAADELFAGYSRYGKTLEAWRLRGKLPDGLWSGLAPLGRAVEGATNRLPGLDRLNAMARVTGLLGAPTITDYYEAASNFARINRITRGRPIAQERLKFSAQSDLEQLSEYDIGHYMTDDILVKVDRAAMAASLETRAPFLDHEVAEFAFSLPPQMKRYRGDDGQVQTKWPLRQLLYQHVHRSLIERPKMGFGVPIADWLRGGLKDWAASYVLGAQVSSDDLLDARAIECLWTDHQRGTCDNSAQLWSVLMFCAWKQRWH